MNSAKGKMMENSVKTDLSTIQLYSAKTQAEGTLYESAYVYLDFRCCCSAVKVLSKGQQQGTYGGNQGTDYTDDSVNFLGFRVVFFFCKVVNTCTENEDADDDTNNLYEHYFFLHFNKNAEFVITSTEPALCTRAPTTGFNAPIIAMAINFKVIEKIMLSLMVVIMCLDSDVRY